MSRVWTKSKEAEGVYEQRDLGVTRAHVDVAERTLQIVQIALRSSRFGVAWKCGAHRPSDLTQAKSLLLRRVWTFALLDNEWFSAAHLSRICARSSREVCADLHTVRGWMSADTDFYDLVAGVCELVDSSIAAMTGADRLFAVGRTVARNAGLSRRRGRALPPAPSPRVHMASTASSAVATR